MAVVSRVVPRGYKARLASVPVLRIPCLRGGGEPQDHCRLKDQEACGRADHTTESRRPSRVYHVGLEVTQRQKHDLHCLDEGFCTLAKFFFMEPGDPGQ